MWRLASLVTWSQLKMYVESTSVKKMMSCHLAVVDDSLTKMSRGLWAEVVEGQMLVKREVHEELLKDSTSSLWSTAHYFQPSWTAAGVAKEEGTRQSEDVIAVQGVIPNQQRPAPFEGKVAWDILSNSIWVAGPDESAEWCREGYPFGH